MRMSSLPWSGVSTITAEPRLVPDTAPLGNATTAEGYIHRLEGWMQHKSQQSLAQAGIFPHVVQPDSAQPVRTVQRLHAIAHA